MNTIDKILIILGLFFVGFCAAVFWVFLETGGQEPTALVTATAGAVIAEIIILFRIKAGKRRSPDGDLTLQKYNENHSEQNPS